VGGFLFKAIERIRYNLMPGKRKANIFIGKIRCTLPAGN